MNTATSLDLESLPVDVQQRLADVLDSYLGRLERGETPLGEAPEVESLLHDYPELAEPLRRHLDSLRFVLRAATPTAAPQFVTPDQHATPPRELGDFLLLHEIGRGGMGIVYEALQRSLGRRVALKVLPFAAVLEPKQIARFHHEAQAAAQLHHPHIVPVFGVGCERGVHYYSMQLVEGQSLEQAIRERRRNEAGSAEENSKVASNGEPSGVLASSSNKAFSPDATSDFPRRTTEAHSPTVPVAAGGPTLRDMHYYRHVARLMQQAADALHYAHEHGIVHRDVKPSNLLVDARGQLWITDFGLARMQTDANLTATGDILGTMRYMSPEQAAGQNHLIDHRTDIYSLGTTLYELLTLHPLHDGNDRASILRHIEKAETPNPRQYDRRIPRDLETILLKTLAPERDQRYASARELAEDLDNFLEGRPTLARRPSTLDRLSRWASRHRLTVLSSSAVLLLAFVASIAVAFMLAQANRRTEAALKTANNNYRQARDVVERFLTRQARRLGEVPGTEPLQEELLRDTLAYYQDFIAQAMDDPPLRGELAEAYFYSGEAAEKLNDKSTARTSYEQAVALFTTLLDEQGTPELQGQLANALNNLGLLQWELGEKPAAGNSLRAAARHYEACAFAMTAQPRFRDRWTTALSNLAMIEAQSGRAAEAGTLYQKALSIQEQLIAEYPRESGFRRGLAVMLNNVSHWRRHSDLASAVEFCQLSLATQREIVRLRPDDDAARFDLSLTWNNLGSLRGDERNYAEAAQAHQEAIAIQEQLARKRPGVVRYRRDLAISHNNLGHIRNLQRQPEEALLAFREARRQLELLVADYPRDGSFRSVLAGVWNNEGLALEKAGEHPAALLAYESAIRIQNAGFDEQRDRTLAREALNQHYRHYMRVAARLNRTNEWTAGLARWRDFAATGESGGKPLLAAAADIAAESDNTELTEDKRSQLRSMSLDLLETAGKAGSVGKKDLEEFAEFAILRGSVRFDQLAASWK